MKRFEYQVAVVTGGADGIGLHLVRRLRHEGARVVVMDRAVADDPEALVVDVADEGQVDAAFAKVLENYGRIEVLIHCAGIVGPNATKVVDVDVEAFDQVYQVNLRGSFLVARAAIRAMVPRDFGRILLFASIAGKEGNAGMSAYSATKAGVIGLTKSIGKEYAETGITVNAIAPAVIRTAMVEAMDPWQVDYMTAKIPMKRCGSLDEVAALSCWIVSPEASFCTGAVFDLSGGRATY